MTMATVGQDANGNLVLIDPDACAVAMAVAKHNCKATLEANADRVAHFRRRQVDTGYDPIDVVIVIANVDDVHGRILADALMPGFDWQPFRDKGEVPFARGLAGREGVQLFLREIDKDASDKLEQFEGLAVVVVDYGTAEVFGKGTSDAESVPQTQS